MTVLTILAARGKHIAAHPQTSAHRTQLALPFVSTLPQLARGIKYHFPSLITLPNILVPVTLYAELILSTAVQEHSAV
jgi:hypothetical protein